MIEDISNSISIMEHDDLSFLEDTNDIRRNIDFEQENDTNRKKNE